MKNLSLTLRLVYVPLDRLLHLAGGLVQLALVFKPLIIGQHADCFLDPALNLVAGSATHNTALLTLITDARVTPSEHSAAIHGVKLRFSPSGLARSKFRAKIMRGLVIDL
jgi:hypothetical protein